MTFVLDDLHVARSPQAALDEAVLRARVNGQDRLIVRCPDRQTDGIHALGASDIASMLRRHGRIHDLQVTESGTIVAAADLCDRRGHVAVWTGQAIGPWHPTDIMQRGLGGSETAAVRLAEQLAAMGYIVTLYGDFDKPGLCADILLRRYQEYDPSQPLHALIGFRYAPLFDQRPNAEFTALWLEDLAPAEGLTPARARNIDRVCTVSSFHKGQTERAHPWVTTSDCPVCDGSGGDIRYDGGSEACTFCVGTGQWDPPQVTACRNGIQVDWFREEPAPERETRVVYSSSPDRGGDIILEVWPQVRERVPDAELVLTYPRWIDICAERFLAAHDHMARIRELLEQPGVSRIEGGLGQKQLANLMRASMVWVAPSYYTPAQQKFEETSCISCMEAQAAGLVVVGSNWGALTENVAYGTLLDGDPADRNGAWRTQFVDAVVRGLTDEQTQAAARLCGPEMMRDMDWRGAAEQLAAMFTTGPSAQGGERADMLAAQNTTLSSDV